MMTIFHLAVLGAMSVLLMCHASAQDMETFLKEARKNHPRLHATRYMTDAIRAKIRGAGAWPAPELSFEFFATPISSANPFRDGMENDYSVTQMIHFPGKLGAMERMANEEARMQERSSEAVSRDLAFEVKDAWSMVWMAQRKRAVLWESREVLDRILSLLETRIATGRASQTDLLRLSVERERLLNEDETAKLEEESGKNMLRAACALPADYRIGLLPQPNLTAPPDSAEPLVRLAIQKRAELRAMDAERAMRGAALDAARRDWYPDFMIRGMYKQMLMMDQTDQWALMIGVTLPMAPWASERVSSAVEEASLSRLAVDRRYDDMRLMISAEVRSAFSRAGAFWNRRERLISSMLPQSRTALDLQITRYQTNTSDILALLDALRMHMMIAMDKAMAEGEYLRASVALDRSLGMGGEE